MAEDSGEYRVADKVFWALTTHQNGLEAAAILQKEVHGACAQAKELEKVIRTNHYHKVTGMDLTVDVAEDGTKTAAIVKHTVLGAPMYMLRGIPADCDLLLPPSKPHTPAPEKQQ